MSAVALRNGVYRVENGALVFVRPFVDPVDKSHGISAGVTAPINAMAFRVAS